MINRSDYGGHVPAVSGGGVVSSIATVSPAERAGVHPGDVVVSVDGEPLRDVIDWQWQSDGDRIELAVLRHGTTATSLVLERAVGELWGIEFTEMVFDGVRTCRNRCAFCFMAQLPRGLRRALYLRDDDFRLSFLEGNFITLTNLSDADVDRIVEQHLSPLYVSVHAVDPCVRQELICAREDRALQRLDELLDAGIEVHAQIVLVPGVNDGAVLEESLTWLAERVGICSVGVVPLGFTAHQNRFATSYDRAPDAAAVIAQVSAWQEAFRKRDGVTWVYLSDEFYLSAGVEVPVAEYYDGLPQFENGIGFVRDWLDSVEQLRGELAQAALGLSSPVVVVTGELFAPILSATTESLEAQSRELLSALVVRNRFFAGNVTATGLLVGEDLVPAMAGVAEDAVVLVPDIVVNADGLLLDDMPASELGMRSGRDVRLVSFDAAGLLEGLQEAAAGPHRTEE